MIGFALTGDWRGSGAMKDRDQLSHLGSALIVDRSMLGGQRLACELRQAGVASVFTASSLLETTGQAPRTPESVILLFDDDIVASIAFARHLYRTATIVVLADAAANEAFEIGRAGADILASRSLSGQRLLAVIGGSRGRALRELSLPSLARAEWEYLHTVLKLCDGNRSEAARRLRIHRSVLQRKLARTPPAC